MEELCGALSPALTILYYLQHVKMEQFEYSGSYDYLAPTIHGISLLFF